MATQNQLKFRDRSGRPSASADATLAADATANAAAGAGAGAMESNRGHAVKASAKPLLSVEGLTVAYGDHTVASDISFELPRGGSLALIGESGSGKTTVARTVLRLLPPEAKILGGRVEFDGVNITKLREGEFRPLRGRRLGFVPQDPNNALNPVRTIGSQAHEAAKLIGDLDADARRERILEAFTEVGLPDPERVYRSYPHQLSGGMLQRALIGLAILPRPSLIVADEPTSGLDVTIQKVVLDLFTELRDSLNISLLFITHDLAVAAERAEHLVVLKDGQVQEAGVSKQVFLAPRSAYTKELHTDVPAINPTRYRDLYPARDAERAGGRPAQIEVRSIAKTFSVGGRDVVAVDDVSFSVQRGKTHALVGESGSGKTTAIRLLLGLEEPDSGEIVIGSASVSGHSRKDWRALRRHLQLVYQNPFTSLDPTWKVERIVREPLDRFGIGDRSERRERVADALTSVGLSTTFLSRRPTHLSGGQRQRVAIARALVMRPDVVVLDEPTSALDVTVQAGIIDLLFKLQTELDLTYLFVSHDLSLVRQLADTVTVMKHGRVVEAGAVEQIFSAPADPYTRALIDAIPRAPQVAA